MRIQGTEISKYSSILGLVLVIGGSLASARAETAVLSTSHDDGKDSSITIQKRHGARIDPDFEIVAGEEEIVGDPIAGQPQALTKWKEACAEWKKDLKENKDSPVVYSSCGSPQFQKEPGGSGQYTYKSNAKYRMKVRIRDAGK